MAGLLCSTEIDIDNNMQFLHNFEYNLGHN
jgi:hypothetical protein